LNRKGKKAGHPWKEKNLVYFSLVYFQVDSQSFVDNTEPKKKDENSKCPMEWFILKKGQTVEGGKGKKKNCFRPSGEKRGGEAGQEKKIKKKKKKKKGSTRGIKKKNFNKTPKIPASRDIISNVAGGLEGKWGGGCETRKELELEELHIRKLEKATTEGENSRRRTGLTKQLKGNPKEA